jgi:hypothetical protein
MEDTPAVYRIFSALLSHFTTLILFGPPGLTGPVVSLTAALFALEDRKNDWTYVRRDILGHPIDTWHDWRKSFLLVVDIPWDEAGGQPKVLINFPHQQQAEPLEEQSARSFRLHIVEGRPDWENVVKAFGGLNEAPYPEGELVTSPSFAHLESQWSADEHCTFWQVQDYHIKGPLTELLGMKRAIEFAARMLKVTKNIYVYHNQDGGIVSTCGSFTRRCFPQAAS